MPVVSVVPRRPHPRRRDWDYDLWVRFALAVWLYSLVVGAGYFGRKAGPLAKGLATQGWTPEVAADWKPLRRLSAIETWLLVPAVVTWP